MAPQLAGPFVFLERRSVEKEFRVTFGRRYLTEEHPTFPEAHPDGWFSILAANEDQARQRAFGWFGQAWAFIYPAECMTEEEWLRMYPRGQIHQVIA